MDACLGLGYKSKLKSPLWAFRSIFSGARSIVHTRNARTAPSRAMATFFTGGFEIEREEMVNNLLSDCRKIEALKNLNLTDRYHIQNLLTESLTSYTKKLQKWKLKVEGEWPLKEAPRCFEIKCDRLVKEMQVLIQKLNPVQYHSKKLRKSFSQSNCNSQSQSQCQSWSDRQLSEAMDIFCIQVGMLTLHDIEFSPSIESMGKKADSKQFLFQGRSASKNDSQGSSSVDTIWSRFNSPVADCKCHSCLRLGRFL